MKDIVSHPELFQSYPELKNLRVQTATLDNVAKGTTASFGVSEQFPEGVITINPPRDVNNCRLGPKDRSAFIHELQHAIQDMEGFAEGGHVRDFEAMKTAMPDKKIIKQANALAKWSAETGKPVDDLATGKPPVYLGPEWHYSAIYLARDPDGLKNLNQEYQVASDPRGSYVRLTGEVEARLIQKRLDMMPEQRRAEPPWVTMAAMLRAEGVLKKDQEPREVLISRWTCGNRRLARRRSAPSL